MNVNLSTGVAGHSALQALASTSRNRVSQASDFSIANQNSRPEGPPPGPPPNGGFELSMSTTQFAQSTQQNNGDPLMALDSDGDGAVSGAEFGIGDGSDDQVNALFAAIDSNGDGSLSASETDSFGQQMMQALQGQQGQQPPPAPPADGGSAQDFVKQLAQLYASLQAEAGAGSAVSVQA